MKLASALVFALWVGWYSAAETALAAGAARSPAGATIFASSFGDEFDVNYDEWPDYWERDTSAEYPHYTHVGIAEDATTDDGRCLQIELDGGGARVSSPKVRILPKFGYLLRMKVKTAALVYTRVTAEVDLLNEAGESLQVERSAELNHTSGWTELAIGPFRPQGESITSAIIRIDAPRGRRGDLAGEISIDEVTLERLPSMIVTTGRACNVYDGFDEIEVTCMLSGVRDKNPEIRFQLIDASGKNVPGKESVQRVTGQLIEEDLRQVADSSDVDGNRVNSYEGRAVWRPRIEDFGFYKIRMTMLPAGRNSNSEEHPIQNQPLDPQEITLAVLPQLPRPQHGEFGWTLPVGDHPLSLDLLTELLPRVGVHWVKTPVWYEADNPARGEAIVRFAERLSAAGIEVVGIIDDPNIANYKQRDPGAPSDAANLLLADPSFWQPKFEHVMTRLSLRLRWWQLGNDLDTSFYGYPDLREKVLGIRQHLYRFGQNVRLGLGWRWPDRTGRETWSPPVSQPMWEFEQMSADPQLSADELDEQLARTPRTSASRWVLVDPTRHETPAGESGAEPVDDSALRHETRIREFMREMIVAKMHAVDGIFLANPFTGPDGVMNVDGTPGELLLPWRTTANLLSETRYLGGIELPGGSTNHVFANLAGELVMIVWNDQPATEELYLGETVEQIDVWGKRKPLQPDDEGRVALDVGRLPIFVLGLNPAVTQWRMSVAFDQQRVPSIFSRGHPNGVRGVNAFRQGVGGKFSIFVPALEGEQSRGSGANARWEILPREGDLSAGPGQPFDLPIQILLDESTYGRQPVRIDFEIDADRPYRFSVWRNLYVGLGDLTISVRSHLDDKGQLVVEQTMANSGAAAADFKCLLYAPPRRRKRTQVVMLGPEPNTKIYQYPDGEELIGSVLKLRAEEMGGSRVLIHRFTAERGGEPPPSDEADTPPPAMAESREIPPSG